MCRKIAYLLFVIMNIFLVSTLAASTFLSMDKFEMVENSSRIIKCEVIDTYSFWEGDMIYTVATVDVSETIMGDDESEMQIISPGGKVDGIGRKVFGAVEFKPYQKMILFLKPFKSEIMGDIYSTVNWQQGKIDIITGGDIYDQFVIDTIPDEISGLRERPDISSYAKMNNKPKKIASFVDEIKEIIKETKK